MQSMTCVCLSTCVWLVCLKGAGGESAEGYTPVAALLHSFAAGQGSSYADVAVWVVAVFSSR